MHSVKNFIPGKTIEGGGELIGSNHPLWNSYKQHFRLNFSDVKDYGNSPVRFGNRTLSFEDSQKLTDELEKQLKALTELAESIVDPFEPWSNRNAKHLDAVSYGDWVRKAKCSGLCKEALDAMLATDNGVPSGEQSLLGVLAMVKGGGLDRFSSITFSTFIVNGIAGSTITSNVTIAMAATLCGVQQLHRPNLSA